MKGVRNILVWGLSSAMMAMGAGAAISVPGGGGSDTPYTMIGERNVFDLRTPPPMTNNPGPPVQPSNVKLSGLTTILGYKQAVFNVAPPGKPAATVVMSEGERQGGLEVVKIDMEERTASVKNDDQPAVLHLDEPKGFSGGGGNPAVTGGGPVPGAAGGVTVPSPAVAPRGGGAAPNQFTYGARGAGGGGAVGGGGGYSGPATQFNPQATTLSSFGSNPDTGAATSAYGTSMGASNPYNPTRPVRTGTDTGLTPEQDILLIEARRDQLLKNGDPNGMSKILPPTPFTPQVLQDNQPQQTQTQNPTMPAPPAPPLGSKVRGNIVVPGIGQ